MAIFQGQFTSEALGGLQTGIHVIQPEHFQQKERRVMYLLHGMTDNETTWTRRSAVERYADTYGFTVIMPNVDTSFYSNMKYGKAYWTYVSEELPKAVETFFGIKPNPASTYVAGLSMGGYGAFKLALNQPERFVAAASFSGALDAAGLYAPEGQNDQRKQIMYANFGENPDFTTFGGDLFHLATEHKENARTLPELYQYCGTEDFLYDMNIAFRDHLKQLNYLTHYEESPAPHTWDYWDYCIEDFMKRVVETKE
ncbi:alpha/beta hydrolase [Alkalicoccobacillus porphyridii]|uniref:alpha/beta hydrolase n=1 Tax=Alkalicoccobacillus porphyridii TaxID=2597270 RepID=UPI00163D6C92|nr:alpha/beta hydrolase family protein [Alkalicoccobacillus porphyridii]